MTKGICLASLKQEIKEKKCSLQDGEIASTEDIIVTIQNNSGHEVIINEGDSLCYVSYYRFAI